MDTSSPTGQESAPAIEYTAQASSPVVSGEVKITICDGTLAISALFSTVEIPFAEINAITFTNHIITVKADSGDYSLSRMGSWAQPFYDALTTAYSEAVLRSMFISGNPLHTAYGDFRYTEDGATHSGSAPIHVYDNSLTLLPPDLSARRVPLCFVTGMEKGDYSLTLTLDNSSRYMAAKLGYETENFANAVEKQISKLHKESLEAVKEIAPSIPAAQASQIAGMVLRGAAAPIEQLSAIYPSFVSALESKIAETRAAEYYKVFSELCDKPLFWIGFRKNELPEQPDDESETGAPDPYLIWLIVPSPDGRHCAVEFTEADTATFVYRVTGDFSNFARKLNRALEAIDFKREIIRLSDDELRKRENADYYMVMKRTIALQFVRKSFTGRVIHTSLAGWRRKLEELWNSEAPPSSGAPPAGAPSPVQSGSGFCKHCGALQNPGMKFCGRCGAKYN